MVAFCREVIESRYQNAHFFACAAPDFYSKTAQSTNPKSLPSVEDVLCAEAPFDLVLAFSVFTHLLPEEMDSYFSLFDRVVAPEGRLVLTFLFLDEWTRPAIRERRLGMMIAEDTPETLPEPDRVCYASPSNPRAAVAIALEDVLHMANAHGFQPDRIVFGQWRGLSFWRPGKMRSSCSVLSTDRSRRILTVNATSNCTPMSQPLASIPSTTSLPSVVGRDVHIDDSKHRALMVPNVWARRSPRCGHIELRITRCARHRQKCEPMWAIRMVIDLPMSSTIDLTRPGSAACQMDGHTRKTKAETRRVRWSVPMPEATVLKVKPREAKRPKVYLP